MSEDENLQRLAELREKWDLDERSARQNAIDEGLEEGRKEGLKKKNRKGARKSKSRDCKKIERNEYEDRRYSKSNRLIQRENRRIIIYSTNIYNKDITFVTLQ